MACLQSLFCHLSSVSWDFAILQWIMTCLALLIPLNQRFTAFYCFFPVVRPICVRIELLQFHMNLAKEMYTWRYVDSRPFRSVSCGCWDRPFHRLPRRANGQYCQYCPGLFIVLLFLPCFNRTLTFPAGGTLSWCFSISASSLWLVLR